MKCKTMLVGVLIAGSMQQIWGMKGSPNAWGTYPYRFVGPYGGGTLRESRSEGSSGPLMNHSNSMQPSNNNNPPPSSNNNNNAAPKQEVSDIARLAAALEAMNQNVVNTYQKLNERMTRMEQTMEDIKNKVQGLENSNRNCNVSLDHIGRTIDNMKSKVDIIVYRVNRIK